MTRLLAPFRHRWYAWVGLLAFVVPIALLVAVLLVAVLVPRLGDAPLEAAMIVPTVIHLAAYPWLIWVCPYLESGNLRARRTRAPKRLLRDLQWLAWAPVLYCGAMTPLQAIAPLILALYSGRLADAPQPQWGVVIATGAGTVVFALPAFWLTRRMRPRLVRATILRRECFACGYDLRGSPTGVCPECGWDNAAMMDRPDAINAKAAHQRAPDEPPGGAGG